MADMLMSWHIVTSEAYRLGNKVENDLYFLSDTHEIYRGSESYTQAVVLYDTTLPERGALNKLYVDKTSLQGSIYDGTAWQVIVKSIVDTVEATGSSPVSGKAVAEYVSAQLANIPTTEQVVSEITYSADDHILNITKGDVVTPIVLGNLGCSLSFTSNKLQLVDASNTPIGSEIDLDQERFVMSGSYDADNEELVLIIGDKGGTAENPVNPNEVRIPVSGLIDVYTVDNGDTAITLSMSADRVITAAINLSKDPDNAIENRADGLYVPKTDISGLMEKVNGDADNLPILDGNGNLVDSGVSISSVGQATLYQGTDISIDALGATPAKGDMAIITTTITGDKTSKTAYFFDGTSWVAMDGNVNAENVYFQNDLTTTSAIGNITLTNGQATIAAAGKNLKQVFDTIFVKEKSPTTTQPSVSISAPQNKAYEVGTTVTPTYTATLNAGSYTYGPATGIRATSWAISDTKSHSATTNSGSFDAFVVADNENYTITATATYDDGAEPVTNVGNPYPTGKIVAGSKSKTSSAVTGYRAGFYGAVNAKEEITSAVIRSLAGKSTAKPAKGNVWNIPVSATSQRVIFAYPSDLGDPTSVIDVAAMNSEMRNTYISRMITVEVEGANGYEAATYKVYYDDFAGPYGSTNTIKVTI